MLKTAFRCMMATAVLLAAGMGIMGCATMQGPAQQEAMPSNISYSVPDSAELTKVSYYFKEYKGASRLHMELTLKNLSPETKRFRVNIFLPEGPSGGGLYPRKVKDDMKGIEAGKELTQEFPMYFDRLPSGFTIIVKELT
jgi:hypothetical protein